MTHVPPSRLGGIEPRPIRTDGEREGDFKLAAVHLDHVRARVALKDRVLLILACGDTRRLKLLRTFRAVIGGDFHD